MLNEARSWRTGRRLLVGAAHADNAVGHATFFATGVSQVSDVASGPDGSVWVTGVTGTFNIVRGSTQVPTSYGVGGSRIADRGRAGRPPVDHRLQ